MASGRRTQEEKEGSEQTAALKAQAKRQRDARIVALFLSGEPIVRISERVGVSSKTVTTIVRERMPGALTDTRNRA